MKVVKCTNIEIGEAYLTVGKLYEVTGVDGCGDIWIIDDTGTSYFLYPSECEVVA